MEELVFPNDIGLRKQLFDPGTFAHPAKMQLHLQKYLIERYTKPGDTILDPMAGAGTALIACLTGRNVICVELEQKFVEMQKANWLKLQQQGADEGYKLGTATLLQGDARQLETLLKEKADCAVTSPPYAAQGFKCDENPANVLKREKKRRERFPMRPAVIPGRYGDDYSNIGNLPYGEVDTVITSPPYSDSPMGGGLNVKPPREGRNDPCGRSPFSPSQRGAGKYDAVISSPPYAETRHHPDNREDTEKLRPGQAVRLAGTAGRDNPNNIGNLPYGEVAVVMTSPPYEKTLQADSDGGIARVERLREAGYDAVADRISVADNWRLHKAGYGDVSAIITSPPYEAALEASSRHIKGGIPGRDKILGQTGTYATLEDAEIVARKVSSGFQSPEAIKIIKGSPRGYAQNPDNIGNLKSDSYLQAMLQVYQQCHAVLKPGGWLILVVKNFIRNKQIVHLDADTLLLAEEAGFQYVETLQRKLTQQSFWRILYHKKYPEVPMIEHEDILVFKKGG